ncbi:MAG: MarR family transcriptional regulator [Clostridiales bacterium]|nr:MarR family transcriptional regulator [Clostridiales bacterium]
MQDASFHYLLMATHTTLQKKLLAQLKDTGLTLGQPKVLDYLKEHDGANQTEIARGCHIEAASLTSILNRMEEKGIIERRMLNGNRRSLHVFLTDKGRELGLQVDRSLFDLEAQGFAGIDDTERQQFIDTLLKIYHNYCQEE